MARSLSNWLALACVLAAANAFAEGDDVTPAENAGDDTAAYSPAPTAPVAAPLAVAPVAVAPAAPHNTLSFPTGQLTATPVAQTPVAPTPAAPALSSNSAPPPSITVGQVEAPSIDMVGVLTEKTNGLPAAAWKDTTPARAAALLSWYRSGITQTGMRDLIIRLLMSQGAPPSGAPEHWLVQRVEALLALGADEKADELLAAVPDSMSTDQLRQMRAQLLLVRGDAAGACKLQSGSPDNAFWQKFNIICKASSNQKDEAQLALDVWRESNAADDAFMQEAVRRLGDKTFSMKTFPAQLSLFDVGVVRLAGELDKLKDKLDTLPPVMLKYIAADVSLDPKLRDKAEGRAITLGLLPVKDATKIPPQPFSTPLASDVTTLVTSFAAGNPVTEADNAVIARLALGPASAVQDTRRVARLLSLIEPFGYRVPAEQWGKLFARKSRYDGDAPPAALVDQLYAAAQAGRKAEVILLSGLILSANDMEKTHELVLLPVIRALLICGLTQEAHGIAYDALQSYRAR